MSPGFSSFLARYHSVGSQKADGYGKTFFSGLLPHEKQQAFDMLADEARADPNAAEWLFLLDPQRAEATCLQILGEQTDRRFTAPFILLFQLWKHTGEGKYQQEMIDHYAEYGDAQRPLAVEYIAKTTNTAQLADFLKSVVLLDANETAVARASYHLLRLHGVPSSTDEERLKFRAYLASLKASSVQVKRTTFSELERAFPV